MQANRGQYPLYNPTAYRDAPLRDAPKSDQDGAPGACPTTRAARRQAVERVIRAMSTRLDEPLSLQDMAEIALFSPYHFNRVFRDVTGIPPQKFQAALRMETAKRLLLTTRLSVTDVCFEVGYNSLGTFTTHFTRDVGVPPRQLRRLVENGARPVLPVQRHDSPAAAGARQHGLSGHVTAPASFTGPIFVGLFSTPMPQNCPAACGILTGPGAYQIGSVPDGRYYIFATGVEQPDDSLAYLLPENDKRYVGACPDPVLISGGQISGHTDVTLRRTELTDPPILMALPFLFEKHNGAP